MRFECPGRTLATLGGIWQSTFQRWIDEGMPAEWTDMPTMLDALGLEPHIWTKPRAEMFVYPSFEREVLAESDRTITYVNGFGIVCTEFKIDSYKSMPHFERFPVTGRDDWPAHKRRLQWDDARVGEPWRQQKAELAGRTAPAILAFGRVGSLYGSLREMFGVERLSTLFYDDRALVEEAMDTVLALLLRLIDELLGDFVPDAVCLWEDMAYHTSSLLGPRWVRELMLPRYKVMTARLREKGVPYILLDSDGNIDELIPIWLDAGIDGVVPMEAQAGMDTAVYRRKYPKLLMLGGVNKMALAGGREAIDAEMDKIRRTLDSGGLIPWFDHGLPHDVSYDSFLYYVEKLRPLGQ